MVKNTPKKYEIPIDQLSYEYIGTCNDVKKLERIVRILRSGEEGNFPDLQQTAEDRLRLLNPNSRQLRDEQPVLTRANMTNEEWTDIASDLGAWKKEVAMKDLKLTEENKNDNDDSYLPPVRQPLATKNPDKDEAPKQNSCMKKPAVSDYASWDKYDPDVELLKMDLDEERAAEKKKNQAKQTVQSDAIEARLQEVGCAAEKLSETERQELAEQKKNQGNEYYKAKDYDEANRLYSESLEVWPTLNAYNNRAQCNLKQCNYSEALADANSALKLEKKNVKARYRRGLAYKGLNKITEALFDMHTVLISEPDNVPAYKMLNKLRLKRLYSPRMLRIMHDDGPGKQRIVETSEEEVLRNGLGKGQYVVNHMGMPKYFCTCDLARKSPRDRRLIEAHHPPPIASPKPKIVEITDEPEVPKTTSSMRMPIIEVNKLEADEKSERKNVVIDKRSKIAPTEEINLKNGESDSEVKESSEPAVDPVV